MHFMKYLIPVFLSGLLLFSSKLIFAQIERPKLVVGIVVDQMRWDYLYRFADKYGQDGFKRMMNDGFNCQQTFINYLPSFTAAGHASIYTGSVPALHGIVGNEWFDRNTGRSIYCTEDSSVVAIGGSEDAGKMSPRNLLATTITDELRLATNFQSRVIGLSLKDRGAILPAGHTANAAYWYDVKTGKFMTSSYYRNDLPEWLLIFNKRNLSDSLMNLDWQTLYPIAHYTESSVDKNPYEGSIKGERNPVFPHLTSTLSSKNKKKGIRYTPFGNTLLRMLAEACIEKEQLGQRQTTDFLTISFSATDYAGHLFGPNSIEIEDVYLWLDQDIAGLLKYLDQQLGKGNYLVFLTADHAAAQNAFFMEQNKIPAKSLSFKKLKHQLNQYLFSIYKDSSLVRSLYNYQVFLDHGRMQDIGIKESGLLRDIQIWLENQEGITAVYNLSDGSVNNAPEPLSSMIKNGYFRNRCGGLQLILNPQWYSGYGQTGTTHGGWNPYDTHIPLLWYGWHVPEGESFQPTSITDIAPTLAALLHIQMPNACVGKVIEPVVSNNISTDYGKKNK